MSQTFKGIIAMIFAALFFSMMNACVKFLQDLSPMETIFFRSIVMVIFLAIFWLYAPPRKGKKPGGWGKLGFRALTGGISMLALFYNIATIPLGTASAFAQTMPIYIIIFSFFAREKIRLSVLLACVLGFIGVFFICDPSTKSLGIDNIIAGILSGLMMALAFVSLKGLKDYFDESVIIMVFGLTMSVIGGVLMFVDIPNLSGFYPPSLKDWIGILALGIFGTLGQVFLTHAYMLAPAGLVAPIDYTRILWGVVFGVILGDTLPNLITLFGIIFIICSGIIITLPVFIRDYRRLRRIHKRSKHA